MATQINRWFFLEPKSEGGSRFARPDPTVPNLHLCGFAMSDPDDKPVKEARWRLPVVRFNGDQIVVRASAGGKSGTATIKLERALPAYVDWCRNTGKLVLNESNPAGSLQLADASAVEDDEAVQLGVDDRPPEQRLPDTTPLAPVAAKPPK